MRSHVRSRRPRRCLRLVSTRRGRGWFFFYFGAFGPRRGRRGVSEDGGDGVYGVLVDAIPRVAWSSGRRRRCHIGPYSERRPAQTTSASSSRRSRISTRNSEQRLEGPHGPQTHRTTSRRSRLYERRWKVSLQRLVDTGVDGTGSRETGYWYGSGIPREGRYPREICAVNGDPRRPVRSSRRRATARDRRTKPRDVPGPRDATTNSQKS